MIPEKQVFKSEFSIRALPVTCLCKILERVCNTVVLKFCLRQAPRRPPRRVSQKILQMFPGANRGGQLRMVEDRCAAESWCLAWTYGGSGFLRQGRSLDGFSRRMEADRRGLDHCLELALPHSRARVSSVASAAATCGDARRVAYFVLQEGKRQVSFVGA